jgi:hypothetical protein
MRLPRSRTVSATRKGKAVKISKHPVFQLKGNQRSKTMIGWIHGKKYFITAQKRALRNGDYETVYIISNNGKHSAKEVIEIYDRRWKIEKFFRTAKQSLGLQECQSRLIARFEAHIAMVCIAYVHLEEIKINQKLDSPEDALKWLQQQKLPIRYHHNIAAGEDFHAFA